MGVDEKMQINMKRLRIYLDTSVFGGCFDDEFSTESLNLFAEIKRGKFIPVISDTTLAELKPAPAKVRRMLEHINPESASLLQLLKKCLRLEMRISMQV
jgi:hypothetical protein